VIVKEGHWPFALQYLRVPGYEVDGHIEAVGPTLLSGDLAVVSALADAAAIALSVIPAGVATSSTAATIKITAISLDGGYAEYMIAPAEAVAAIPDNLSVADAARLLGADLATAPDSKSMSALFNDLAPNGKLMIVGASPEPLSISAVQVIAGRRSVHGWASGTAKDSEDTMRFSALSGRPP
jgi:D-arabinose 1-dehydrogenase-like Zn-dependent alcohol dehydrogenase